MARPINPHRAPVRSAFPVLGELDVIMRADPRPQRDIMRLAGVTGHAYNNSKRGAYAPTLSSLEAVAQVLGYRLVLQPLLILTTDDRHQSTERPE